MARQHDFIKLIDKHVGSKIHEYRIAGSLSRQQLAEKVGITHQQLAKYEHGVNRISVGRLLLMCEELGQPIDVFINEFKKDKKSDKVLAKERLSLEMLRSFKNIDDQKVKEAITSLIRVVSKK